MGNGVEVAEEISLDHERQEARVELMIEKGVALSDDIIASVKTSGLIGDKYIMLDRKSTRLNSSHYS